MSFTRPDITPMPEDGSHVVRRNNDGTIDVFLIRVEHIGAITRVKIPSRFVYQTPDGKVHTTQGDAAKWLVNSVKGGAA